MKQAPGTDKTGLISLGDFQQVAATLKTLTGIHLSQNKRAMVSGRLTKRLKLLGLSEFHSYIALLSNAENTTERDAFITALTTNMTRFRREEHHFGHFADQMLPNLVTAARRGKRVRIWSAACSTGEEAYDLAFHMLHQCPEAAKLDVRLLATDIDRSALAAAHDGIYPISSLGDLPPGYQDRFFITDDTPIGMARVRDEVRALIAFRALNLDGAWPFKGKFDVIVCRNVAIYFDDATSDRLWRRLVSCLRPGGTLYAGHSEAVPRDVADVAIYEGPGTFRFPDGYVQGQTAGPQPADKKEKPHEFERKTSRSCG